MSKCRSCGAAIKWVETKRGKNMPVDPEPIDPNDADDDMILVCEDGTVMSSSGILIDDYNKLWHQSHFANCPDAKNWRKSRK